MLSDCLTEVVLYVLYHSRTFSFLYYFNPLSLLLPSILQYNMPFILTFILLYYIISYYMISYYITFSLLFTSCLFCLLVFLFSSLPLCPYLFLTFFVPSLFFITLFYYSIPIPFLLSSPLHASPHCCISLDACMCSLQHRSRQSVGRIGEADSQRCETW